MIKNIPIGRANVAPGICDPLQWSANLQLAINNGIQLTILDPKLPLIHQSITSSTYNSNSSELTILDAKKLFDISCVLDSEGIDNLNLRNLNNIVIDTLDEKFGFGRITDPLITSHYWSPLDSTSKDCYLGVLFNTSELLIFQRSNIRPNNYEVKFNIFQVLLSKLCLRDDNFSNGEVTMSYEQYLSLKVQCFRFSQVGSPDETRLLLSLGLANHKISIYCLTNDIPILATIDVGEKISRQSWSSWLSKGTKYHSYLAVITTTNSVLLYELLYDSKSNEIEISEPVRLQGNSRFLISKCEFHQIDQTFILTMTNTISLKVFKIDSLKSIHKKEHNLSVHSLVNGIFHINEGVESFDINIAYETGQFELVQVDLNALSVKPKAPHNRLTKFVSKSLHKYQLYNSKQQDMIESENNSTAPFLNNMVEGSFINYSTSLNSNGLLSIIYRIYPKNVLNYTILSKFEFNIGFIPISDLYSQINNTMHFCTSLSYMNQLWFSKYNEIPKFPKLLGDNKFDEINAFIENIQAFKKDNFIDINSTMIDIENIADFKKHLVVNFIDNDIIKSLQYLFNFNVILSKSLQVLRNKFPNYDKIIEANNFINDELAQIEKTIFQHLSKIIIYFVNQNNPEITSNIDKFIIITYYLMTLENDATFESKFANEAEIKLSTRFFEESFKVSVNDIVDDESASMITSTTDHKWSRCKLTKLPILELKNKVDELKMFNYLIYDQTTEKNWVINTLMETLNFCIYSGNKKYEIS